MFNQAGRDHRSGARGLAGAAGLQKPEFAAAMTRPVFAGMIIAAALVAFVPAVSAAASKEDTAKKVQEKKALEKKAQQKKDEKKEDKAGGKPLETYGDWTASIAQGKNKTCYALARPKERSPDGKHDQAYIFIADRPAEKVHNEVSIVMGFPIKEGSTAKAKAGKVSFDLVAGTNAFFTKDATEDTQFVDALKHGGVLVIKAPPLKGSLITDTYSLTGFGKAIDRVQKECR